MERVVRERRPALVGYAYLMCGSMADAEDIAQDAIVRTFARGRVKTSVSMAEAYIKRAIANEAINRARHRKVADAKQVVLAGSPYTSSHEAGVTMLADVESAMAALTPRERACIVLRYFEDMPVAQIGATLGLNDGTVKRYLFNAADKLRAQLGDDAVPSEPRETSRVELIERGPKWTR